MQITLSPTQANPFGYAQGGLEWATRPHYVSTHAWVSADTVLRSLFRVQRNKFTAA